MTTPLPAPPLSNYELAIEREALAGFPSEQERIADCCRVLGYYNLDGGMFVRRNEGDYDELPIESTGLTRRIVDVLSSLTYSPPPSRAILDDPVSDQFLGSVYVDNRASQLFHKADIYANLLGVSAVEAVPALTNKPVRLYLWDYSQFIVRAEEEDATAIGHVITRDTTPDGRLRYTWWSREGKRVYTARQNGNSITAGGRSTTLVSSEGNPYGRLPFGFIHAELPVSELTTPGIGGWLADQEASVDQKRYDLSLGVRKYALPKPYISGVSADWQPVDVTGEFMRIPAEMISNGTSRPDVGFLQAQLAVDQIETHIDRSISRVLEAAGVPESVYRMDQSSSMSGDALEAEQKPLVDYARNRQESLKSYEGDVAEAVLAVGGAWLDDETLKAAGRGSNLTVEWPMDLVMVPGKDSDEQDANAMALGLESLVGVARRRFRLSSDEEAVRKLLRVREDNEKLRSLGILPALPSIGVFNVTEESLQEVSENHA